MYVIRKNVFETNSSSCHTLTVCGQKMYDLYNQGKVVCVHKFDYSDDYETYKNVVPDKDFWTLDYLFTYVKRNIDRLDDVRSYEQGAVTEIKKSLESIDKFINCMNECYEAREVVEEYILNNMRLYGIMIENEEVNPLRSDFNEIKTEYSGIEGPTTTISATVYC